VVRQAKEKKLVESIEVRERRVNVIMLQYADDTLFFYKATTQSIMTLKVIKCFELAFGLKVNYSKKKVGGVGVSVNQTVLYAIILNCKIMKAPFTYLRVMVGGIIEACFLGRSAQ